MKSGKIFCVLTDCESGFDVEANFVDHLRNEHDIDKNIHCWVKFAKRKAGVYREPVLEITLDDDGVEEVQTDNDVKGEGDGEKDKFGGQKIDFPVISKNVSRNIFANCRQLLEDPHGQKLQENYKADKALTSEESIGEFFSKFRKKIENIEIPPELVTRLKHSDKKSTLNYSNDLQSHVEKTEKTCVVERKQYERLFRCPVSDCQFTTDKAGMLRGEAAKHLCDSHEVTARDMTPGKFIFIKIKVEKTN